MASRASGRWPDPTPPPVPTAMSPACTCVTIRTGPLGRPTAHHRDTLGCRGWQRRRGQHPSMKEPHSPRHPSLSCDRKKAVVFPDRTSARRKPRSLPESGPPGRLHGYPESVVLARPPTLLLQEIR